MSNYDQRVLERLLSLSYAQTSPAVYREWERIPNRGGWSSDVCQLCGNSRYPKYRYLIRNKANGNMLLIGSKCAADHWGGPGTVGWVPPPAPVVPRAA